jgi:ParB-like chromosome segregation protein Spo0J
VNQLFRDLKLAIEYRPIDSLKAYATNPRLHPPEQLRVLSNSIRTFGLVVPIIIDENDVLVGGHGVLLVAEQLGYADVPVIQLKHLGETEKKILQHFDGAMHGA